MLCIGTDVRVLTEKGFDSIIHIMRMSDWAGVRQGETGAVTQRGLKPEAGRKTSRLIIVFYSMTPWAFGPILSLSPESLAGSLSGCQGNSIADHNSKNLIIHHKWHFSAE